MLLTGVRFTLVCLLTGEYIHLRCLLTGVRVTLSCLLTGVYLHLSRLVVYVEGLLDVSQV